VALNQSRAMPAIGKQANALGSVAHRRWLSFQKHIQRLNPYPERARLSKHIARLGRPEDTGVIESGWTGDLEVARLAGWKACATP